MKPIAVLAMLGIVAAGACSDATDGSSVGRTPVVQLAVHTVTLSAGDSADLGLLPMLPPGFVPPDVRWWSSDPAVVTVRRVSTMRAVAVSIRAGHAVVHADAEGTSDSVAVVVQ
ncbi:MAG: hypothetical protein FIB01_05120 [Gemmatimonadetes bacterium]|nr:hypothetical protein [Gemmatimonadota bacterium]